MSPKENESMNKVEALSIKEKDRLTEKNVMTEQQLETEVKLTAANAAIEADTITREMGLEGSDEAQSAVESYKAKVAQEVFETGIKAEMEQPIDDETFNKFLLLYGKFKAENYITPSVGEILQDLNSGKEDDLKVTLEQLKREIDSRSSGYLNTHDFLEETSHTLYEKERWDSLTPEEKLREEQKRKEEIEAITRSRQTKRSSKLKDRSRPDDTVEEQMYHTDKGWVKGKLLGPSATTGDSWTIQTQGGKLDVKSAEDDGRVNPYDPESYKR